MTSGAERVAMRTPARLGPTALETESLSCSLLLPSPSCSGGTRIGR
jgi:hypothetical protein